MIAGFFVGTTVASLRRQVNKITLREQQVQELKVSLSERKAEAIADRMAAIRAAQEDIAIIQSL